MKSSFGPVGTAVVGKGDVLSFSELKVVRRVVEIVGPPFVGEDCELGDPVNTMVTILLAVSSRDVDVLVAAEVLAATWT